MSQINIKKTDTPLTPSTGRVGIFIDTSDQPKIIDDAGVETPLAGIADAPSDGTPYVRQDAGWVANTAAYQEAATRENNTVLFDNDYIIGQAAARTGDVLIDETDAKRMAVTTMLHNDDSAFGFFETDGTTPFVFVQEIGTYEAGEDNFLDFQYLGSLGVRLTISQ